MLWELALFSILVPTAYWGVHHLRRRPYGSFAYGGMLIGTAALAGVALAGHRFGGPGWVDILGVVALGAAVFQLIIAPLLRIAARWAVVTDRLRVAALLVDVRDLLQPGMGGGDDKRMVAALRDVKAGRVDDAVAALESLRDRAPGPARAAIDERITLLYLSAQRWQDAVRWAERTLLDRRRSGEATERVEPVLPVDDPVAGRVEAASRALGVSPSVAVELVGARLRLGELDAATELAEQFEALARDLPELTLLRFRLYLVFLAHLGRVADVDRLIDPQLGTHVTAAARRYWAGVARHAAGDHAAAGAAFEEARTLARRDWRARALVEQSLRELDRVAAAATPRASALADRMAAAPLRIPPRAPPRRATVTTALVAVNLAVAAVCGLALAGVGDFGSVVRVGANVRNAVEHGEAWRMASSVFVHVGLIHLVVNVLALWSLGRLVEGLFGRARMLAIYGAAGLGGAVASHHLATAGVSAGASGAIFGLLGAALIELALHRQRYRREWRRSLLGALLVVTLAQLAVGFGWAIVDQWAHVGGLVAGVVLGAALSPGWRWAERRGPVWVGRLLAVAAVAAFGWGGHGALTTDHADTLAAQPRVTRVIDGLAVDAPASWRTADGELVEPELFVVLALASDLPGAVDARLHAWARIERERAVERGFAGVSPAEQARLPLPAGWHGEEYALTSRDGLGSTQHYRLVVFAGEVDGLPIVGALYVPEVLSWSGAGALGAILATVRPAG